ncbi:DUF6449 domain-containing protein [Gracilibacillus sp. S3-1-1]|uniref:DUF6449 domain-containing protein n=1 Tax=Gracilibacillus pellucidus TaxID=3095368 RepID=A0ACC6M1L4_9BACI|nr:DUF6449 domain-containing protein [Gracilibacillus sp. S3-1-1]MDX8044831.1 DUF6449 domain-containing protein [Gracilibacillus sp. S3-1-1]
MPSTTSYFKQEIWKQSFRSFGWIGIAYFLALVFLLPLRMLMIYTSVNSSNEVYYYSPENLFEFQPLQLVLLVAVPIIAAMFACRYLHVKEVAVFMHSLPLKRSQLFIQRFMIGYSMLVLPVLIMSFILLVIPYTIDLSFIYKSQDIVVWLYNSLMLITFTYSLSFLIGMITGISIIQAGLSLIAILFPYGITMLIQSNLAQLLIGYTGERGEFGTFDLFLPFIPFLQMFEVDGDFYLNWHYWLICLFFICLTFVLYKWRDTEASHQSITFSVLKPIFKFGVTFCFMLLGGSYFGLIQNGSIKWMTFGYVVGAVFGYIIAEIIIQKTWRVWGSWKGLIAYLAISLIVVLSVVFDWYGYKTNIPNIDDVEAVSFIDDNTFYGGYYDSDGKTKFNNITDKQTINKVIQLHEQIVDNSEFVYSDSSIFINYHLNNGKMITRQYSMYYEEEFKPYLKPIIESEEYKKSSLNWLFDSQEEIKSVSVNGYQLSLTVNDKQAINELVQAYQQDYLNASYEDLVQTNYYDRKEIEFEVYPQEYYSVPMLYRFENVWDVVEEQDLAKVFAINPKNVSKVAVSNSTEDIPNYYELEDLSDDENWLIVNDTNEIEQLTDMKIDPKGTWTIVYFGLGGDYVLDEHIVSEEELPAFVTEYFK